MAAESEVYKENMQISNGKKETEDEELKFLITNLAKDYSQYMRVNVKAEKAALDEEVEDVLTRLDEFTSLVDMVKGDSELCLNSTLPEIFKKCGEMEKIFERVDKLEQMVQRIKQNLDVMEQKVVEAEEKLDSSSVKKLFSTLQKPLFSKKSPEPKQQVKYEPPEIFKTEEFFPNQSIIATSPSTDEAKLLDRQEETKD